MQDCQVHYFGVNQVGTCNCMPHFSRPGIWKLFGIQIIQFQSYRFLPSWNMHIEMVILMIYLQNVLTINFSEIY